MVKLLDDLDTRNPDCAYRQMDKDLENGVGKNILEISKSSEDEESSDMIDSARIDGQIRKQADEKEIAPNIIGAPEATPSSSKVHSGSSQALGSDEEEEYEEEEDNSGDEKDKSAFKPLNNDK